MVEAEPLRGGVELDDEQVVTAEPPDELVSRHQRRSSCILDDDCIAQRRTEAIEDRCRKEVPAHLRRDLFEHFADQIRLGSPIEEACAHDRCAGGRQSHGLGRQPHTGRPAFRGLAESADLVGRQRAVEELLGELLDLALGKGEIIHPQLVELSSGAEQPRRQWRVMPTDDHEVRGLRWMSEQLGHQRMDLRRRDLLVVVEHDHHRLGEFVQLVGERRDQDVLIREASGSRHLRGDAQRVGAHAADGCRKVKHEPARVIDVVIQREPRARTVERLAPLADDHGLAEAGWGAHHGRGPVDTAVEGRVQVVTNQCAAGRAGSMEEHRANKVVRGSDLRDGLGHIGAQSSIPTP